MDGCMDEWLDGGWMEAWITGKMHGWVFGWVGEQVSEWMIKGMTGWMVSRQMDRYLQEAADEGMTKASIFWNSKKSSLLPTVIDPQNSVEEGTGPTPPFSGCKLSYFQTLVLLQGSLFANCKQISPG